MDVTHIMILVAVLLGIVFLAIVIMYCCCLYSSRCKNWRRLKSRDGGYSYRTQVDHDVENRTQVSVSSYRYGSIQSSSTRAKSLEEQRRRVTAQYQVLREVLAEQQMAWRPPQQQLLDLENNRQVTEWQCQQQVPQVKPLRGSCRICSQLQSQQQVPRAQPLQEQSTQPPFQQPLLQATGMIEDTNRRPVSTSRCQNLPVRERGEDRGSRESRRNRRKQNRSKSLDSLESSNIDNNGDARKEEKTLDLHNYSLRRSKQAFVKFINDNEIVYQKNGYQEEDRFVYIITGRGLHSKDGIPKIKPAVKSYLDQHKYKYKSTWEHAGGMVTVEFLWNQRNPLKPISQDW